MNKILKVTKLQFVCLVFVLMLSACSTSDDQEVNQEITATVGTQEVALLSQSSTQEVENKKVDEIESQTEDTVILVDEFDISDIPTYSGNPYIIVNDNVPFFRDEEITADSFEQYSPLDSLGRCGVALASVGLDIMPTEERESISSVYPTGWEQEAYEHVNGGYLYNRCHILGFQLTGENANEENLITGTRQMNVDAMLPFENMVADYVKETGNHVYMRVTPIFEGDNLLATGVLMEAKSVEDDGEGVLYNVFCYNAQEGIILNYATGENSSSYEILEEAEELATPSLEEQSGDVESRNIAEIDTNGNGQVTIAEAKAAGFEMPITSDHWLYEYMHDADGDGMVGE